MEDVTNVFSNNYAYDVIPLGSTHEDRLRTYMEGQWIGSLTYSLHMGDHTCE